MTRQHIGPVAGWLLALVVAAAMTALGLWQLERRVHKQALLDAYQQAMHADAQPLAAALASGAVAAAVSDCGQWLAPVLVLDNQQHGGRAGHRSFQPWRSDSGAVVLVEQGWRSWNGNRHLPQAHPLAGQHCLRGVLLPAPPAGLRAGQSAAQPLPGQGWLITRLEAASLQPLLPSLPADLGRQILRPHAVLDPGYQLPEAVLPNTLPPDKHLGYAVQWFALAASVLLLALVLTLRRLAGRAGRRSLRRP